MPLIRAMRLPTLASQIRLALRRIAWRRRKMRLAIVDIVTTDSDMAHPWRPSGCGFLAQQRRPSNGVGRRECAYWRRPVVVAERDLNAQPRSRLCTGRHGLAGGMLSGWLGPSGCLAAGEVGLAAG